MHFKALNLQNKTNCLKILRTLILTMFFSNQTYAYIKNTNYGIEASSILLLYI